jgi:hypothetical protein
MLSIDEDQRLLASTPSDEQADHGRSVRPRTCPTLEPENRFLRRFSIPVAAAPVARRPFLTATRCEYR